MRQMPQQCALAPSEKRDLFIFRLVDLSSSNSKPTYVGASQKA
jgi:hypothetical protein